MAVGALLGADHANTVLAAGRADLAVMARPHLADPYLTAHAAARYGRPRTTPWPGQYWRGRPATQVIRRIAPRMQTAAPPPTDAERRAAPAALRAAGRPQPRRLPARRPHARRARRQGGAAARRPVADLPRRCRRSPTAPRRRWRAPACSRRSASLLGLVDGPDFVACLFGALKLGAVVVMANPQLARGRARRHPRLQPRRGSPSSTPRCCRRGKRRRAAAGWSAPPARRRRRSRPARRTRASPPSSPPATTASTTSPPTATTRRSGSSRAAPPGAPRRSCRPTAPTPTPPSATPSAPSAIAPTT